MEVICRYCRKPMANQSCFPKIIIGDTKMFRKVVTQDTCPDCGAPKGKYHHFGCDQEPCPVCGEQLLMHHIEGDYCKKSKCYITALETGGDRLAYQTPIISYKEENDENFMYIFNNYICI